MANELNAALKNAAERIVKYVDNVATMTVQTRFVEVGGNGAADFKAAAPAAETVIRLDGDCSAVLPMRRRADTNELEVDSSMFELHQRNVETAIEYRTKMMEALLQTLKQSVIR
jgi:hypothetical protein